MIKRMITKRIGEILLERGVIDRKKLETGLTYQKEHGGLLGQVLIRLGFTTEEEVALALTAQYGFPYLPLDNYEIDAGLATLIPEAFARKHCLIPVDRIGNALTLAMADPSNVKAVEEVELLTKCVVQAFVSTPTEIEKAIDVQYKHTNNTGTSSPGTSLQPPTDKESGR